jgi:hypothetical protein
MIALPLDPATSDDAHLMTGLTGELLDRTAKACSRKRQRHRATENRHSDPGVCRTRVGNPSVGTPSVGTPSVDTPIGGRSIKWEVETLSATARVSAADLHADDEVESVGNEAADEEREEADLPHGGLRDSTSSRASRRYSALVNDMDMEAQHDVL